MQASDVERATAVETWNDTSLRVESEGRLMTDNSHHTLDAIPAARAILAVLDTRRDGGVPGIVVPLAHRDGSPIILYDLSTQSFWTTAYELGDDEQWFRDRVLSAGQLRYLGQHPAAQAVDSVNRFGVAAGAYLSTRPDAGDLCDVVWRERIDLVIALGVLRAGAAHNVQRVRFYGATLVQYAADGHLAVQPAFPLGERAQHWEDGRSHSRWWHLVHPSNAHLFSPARGRNTK